MIIRTIYNNSYRGNIFYKTNKGILLDLNNKSDIRIFIPFNEIKEVIIKGEVFTKDFIQIM